MFPQPQKPIKQRNEGDCEISVTKTKTGKKIKFRGNCSRTQVELFAKQNGVGLDLDED